MTDNDIRVKGQTYANTPNTKPSLVKNNLQPPQLCSIHDHRKLLPGLIVGESDIGRCQKST